VLKKDAMLLIFLRKSLSALSKALKNAPTVSFWCFVNGRNYRFDTPVAIIRFFFKSALMNASNSFYYLNSL
jgi:hypothetical protein